ncbi:Afadin and alpha-actinin-binding-domain-containing protein [Mycena amicta]|nr:Afadin and alpha-actinin-binding-domain-containing protein [Mycena amicta]
MSHKGVHWAAEPSLSDISSDVLATSSLEYINSQLVAHGFAPAPGLSLDGIVAADLDRLVKCLLGMLSQRVEDMARTEDLTTKLRTLSYDHERLTTMYRAAVDTAANAEREANLHKSRLTATTRLLQSAESAHKQTSIELQRARSALQSVRATHNAELKKKEREMDRMAERWNKLADMQAKAGGAASGLRCVNLKAVEPSRVEMVGTPTLDENALRQSEEARQLLGQENTRLRGLLLGAVNEAQMMLHQVRAPEKEKEDEPAPLTNQTLFPMASADVANEKLASLLSALREAVHRPAVTTNTITPSPSATSVPDDEIEHLQRTITDLKSDIERYQKELLTRATETQKIFDQFANDRRVVDGDVGEASVELMIAPERDVEKERLEKIKQQLEMERNDFTESTVKLGHERAAIAVERRRLEDEKRSWEVEKILAELPPTPNPKAEGSASFQPAPNVPRKSPGKVFTVGASRKAARVPRRSSLVSPPRTKFQPAFETEVIPAPSFSSSLLPTSFVLPPPSPYSVFPAPAPLLLSAAPIPSLLDTLSSPADPQAATSTESIPATPSNLRKPFPMAKPFVPRMTHAYSPVRPSPLSRILMLSQQSPASPEEAASSGLGLSGYGLGSGGLMMNSPLMQLESLPEEGLSGFSMTEDELFPAVVVTPAPPALPPRRELTLAEELGVSESPPESPEGPVVVVAPGSGPGRVFSREPVRYSAAEKGKGRAVEKENGLTLKGRPSSGIRRKVVAGTTSAPHTKPRTTTGTASSASSAANANAKLKAGGPGSVSRARVMAKLPVAKKTTATAATPFAAKTGGPGPRRVLVDSAEAAHVPRRRS